MTTTSPRSGSILIIVAGISALLAGMSLVFLTRNRSDAQESNAFEQEAQARIMLIAACSYIQEASRIGWDPLENRSSVHLEGYGWIDVRDNTYGPKPYAESESGHTTTNAIRATPYPPLPIAGVPPAPPGASHTQVNAATLSRGLLIGVPQRFPMYVMKRPPYAIQNRPGYNPINNQDPTAADYLKSCLRYPDPQPVTDNGWRQDPDNPGGTISAARFSEWEAGDPTPRQSSTGLSWFRLLREPGGSTFVVTCGAGATMGYRTYAEAQADTNGPGPALFQSKELFDAFSQEEVRLFYRVEWSPAIMAIDDHLVWHHGGTFDHYEQFPMNESSRYADAWGQLVHHNMGGTIPMIQRLRVEPANW